MRARLFALTAVVATTAMLAGHLAAQQAPAPMSVADIYDRLEAIEAETGGRLGVAVMREDWSFLLVNRADQRFAMCSTFKLPLAAVILDMIEQRRIRADEALPFTDADVIALSPLLEAARARGESSVTVHDAMRSAVIFSDNGATNLLLRRLGGPSVFTRELHARFAPSFVEETRLDRNEYALNENLPGDVRDSTSPRTMAADLHLMLVDRKSPLRPASRALLMQWTQASETGLSRVRAGLGDGFVAGDKTGTCSPETGEHRAYNDIGWFHAANGSMAQGYSYAVFLDHPTVGRAQAEAAIAEVGRLAMMAVANRQTCESQYDPRISAMMCR